MTDFTTIISLIKAGKRNEARQLLIPIIKSEPNNEKAWQWMYSVSNNDNERISCLKQIIS